MAKTVKKPEQRKAEIVKAARDFIARKGYDNTSMQDIMGLLGIAKGTIYHYFTSKDDLLKAVITDIVEENLATMQERLAAAKGDALEKIQLLAKTGAIADDNASLVDYLHHPSSAALHLQVLAETLNKQAPLYAALIEQGCNEGIFSTAHHLECAELILYGVQILTDRGIYPWTSEALQRRMQALPKLIEQLLQADAGTFDFLFNSERKRK